MSSAPPRLAVHPPAHGSGDFRRALVGVVDSVPETRGIGVVFIESGRLHRLRMPDAGEATIVFELRDRPKGIPFIQHRPALGRQMSLHAPAPALAPRAPAQPPRHAPSSPATEWTNLGLNCGGAVLAWIGVAGLTSLAPVTGGVSGLGAIVMYGGALAASGQCVVSVARTANVYRGRTDINEGWDDSRLYYWTMLAADGVGVLGAGGALKELKATNAALREAGFSLARAHRGETISRPMRRRLTTALELQGAKRVPGAVINRVVRQRLLDGAAGALGLFASGFSGALNEGYGQARDLVVWLSEETRGQH